MTKIITDITKLNEAIVKVNKAANTLSDAIQLVLASATLQAVQHGNMNAINASMSAVGRGVRKTAIAQWLLMHAPVVLEADKDKAKENPFRFSRDKLAELQSEFNEGEKFDAESGLAYAERIHAMHWTDHKEPPLVPESWDFIAAVKKVLAARASYEGKGVKVNGGDLASELQAMLASPAADIQPL